MDPNPDRPPNEPFQARWFSSSKALNGGLCVSGAAGLFAGMLLEAHSLFLCGLAVGILGYLGIRRELRQDLERDGESGGGPGK